MTDLYREHIVDHAQNPRHYGLLDSQTNHQELNPSCGDEINVSLEIEDGKISKIGWEGQGCIISRAAMSVLAEDLIGKEISYLEKIELDHIQGLLGLDETSAGRVKCMLLGLRAVQEAIKKS